MQQALRTGPGARPAPKGRTQATASMPVLQLRVDSSPHHQGSPPGLDAVGNLLKISIQALRGQMMIEFLDGYDQGPNLEVAFHSPVPWTSPISNVSYTFPLH